MVLLDQGRTLLIIKMRFKNLAFALGTCIPCDVKYVNYLILCSATIYVCSVLLDILKMVALLFRSPRYRSSSGEWSILIPLSLMMHCAEHDGARMSP
jgi:hypothetical protein